MEMEMGIEVEEEDLGDKEEGEVVGEGEEVVEMWQVRVVIRRLM